MPATLQFFDMSVSESVPPPYQPIAVTTGPNWRPGDYRFCFQDTYISGASSYPLLLPPGYSWAFTNTALGVAYRQLVAGDTDTFVQYAAPSQFAAWCVALWTVRGVSPGSVPTGSLIVNTILPASSTGGTSSAPSFSVPVGAGVIICQTIQGSGTTFGAPNTGPPTGWTNLVATDGSGVQYTPFGNTPSSMLCAKAFSSAGSTGTFGVQYGACLGSSSILQVSSTSIAAAADVSATAGSITTTSTVTGATFSVSTAVTLPTGNINTVSSVSTAFNPLEGYWISDRQPLPGTPVTRSVVRWSAAVPVGASVTVQTSINNGASWDTAANNRPVPRLQVGDTTTRSVLLKVLLSRTSTSVTAPTVSSLELDVSCDTSTDELVPVGHGMVDKVTVHALAGAAGGGTTINVASSSAVVTRGGGQSGAGTTIVVHVTDLSRAIKRNVWPMPFTVPGGLNYADAVKAMVLDRLPSQTAFSLSSTTRTLPQLVVYGLQQGGDPWQDISELAMAIGFEAFFDPSGVFVFRPVPDPSTGDPVWEFDENAVRLVSEASRELSDEQTFNHIVVVGQSTSSSNPVTAEAFDNNPNSPTYILGPYGEVTERLTFSTVTDQDQAQDVANALLNNSLGASDTVTITVVPHPALEPGDIVKVNISDVNVDGNYMINSMTTSLSPADPQQLVCFRQSTS